MFVNIRKHILLLSSEEGLTILSLLVISYHLCVHILFINDPPKITCKVIWRRGNSLSLTYQAGGLFTTV